MASSNGHKPTPAREWRKTILKTLPSGNTALLRPIDVAYFVHQGHIPDIATNIIAEEAGELSMQAQQAQYEEFMRVQTQFSDALVIAAFVEPRVVSAEQTPGEGEISIGDIDPADREFILQMYNKGLAAIESFRPQQKVDVAGVETTGEDGAASE